MSGARSGTRTLEVPVDSVEAAECAAPFADRIELCDDLATEGWTPSQPLIRAARAISDRQPEGRRPRIIAMIRPRLPESTLALDAAAFVATERVVDASLREIAACIDAGAHEIAIGLLGPGGHIDMAGCATLRDAALARGADVTFLRVFDLLEDRTRGWCDIAALDIRRVLTAGVHGWDASVAPIDERTRVIASDAEAAHRACACDRSDAGEPRGKIAIAAGGGIRASHAGQFLGVTPHLHSSCRAGGRISVRELAALRQSIDHSS